MRPAPLAAAIATCVLAFGLLQPGARAQESRLPDMGSSAGNLLSPAQQAGYGAMMLSQLRHYDYTLEDPLLADWLQGVGNRLAASTDRAGQPFTFFLLREREINAFATLGGYVAVNSGLVLTADSEDEVAAVLAHEVSHVTQQHVLRAVERAQRDQLPVLLAMLGAIIVAQKSSSNSGSNAAMAAIAGAQGLLAQRAIDYTRSNESEADRLGIRLLARAGYDPNAMAGFFERMESVMRANRGGDRDQTPDFLLDHPVTGARIAEAKARAAQMSATAALDIGSGTAVNPLLPGGIKVALGPRRGAHGDFTFARERLRALSADTAASAIAEYEQLARRKPLDDAQRYGQAVAQLRAGKAAAAFALLDPLQHAHPDNLWLAVGTAEALNGMGNHAAADARFDALVARFPGNRPVALTYARLLSQRANAAAGRRAQAVLRPLAADSSDDPNYQQVLGRANETAGDPVRAGEAYAEATYLNGSPERALLQLNTLKRRPDLDYYARARIDARIAAITPTVLELRRQGIKDDDLGR